jgi:hypothetical protein
MENEPWSEPASMAPQISFQHEVKNGAGLLEETKKHFNCKEGMLGELSISVAANLGPGTVGLILYPVG